MKKIVLIALIISFTFSLSVSYQIIKNDEMEKLATLEKEFATPFYIPEYKGLIDSKEVYPLLQKAATQTQVNLFRAGRHFRPDEKLEMIKYLLLTGETRFYDHIQLAKGRMLKAEETQNSKLFLSSIQTKNKNQVGRIHYFDPEQRVSIRPLEASYDYLPIHGRYFAEAKNNTQFQRFLETWSKEVNGYLKDKEGDQAPSYTPADFQPPEAFTEPPKMFFTLTDVSALRYEQYILFAVVLLLLIYYIFNRAKEIGILKMHGVSNLRLWWILVGRLISVAVGMTALGSMLFALGLHQPGKFLYETFLQLGQAYLILMILSLLSFGYIATIKVSQTIKNRKDTQGIFVLNTILKVVCAVVLILTGIGIFDQYADLRVLEDRLLAQKGQLDNWGAMKEYGLVTANVGHSTANNWEEYEAEMSQGDKELYELYPFLSAQGALYIDAQEYEEETLLSNSGGIRSIIVNSNYLKAFPVYDQKGKPVHISEKTADWVLLVSEQYKDREKEIRDYFEEYDDFYLMVDKGQKMKIMWVAKDQYLFSFNPDVFPAEQNKILDPIIQVKTEQNHLFTYRGGIRGGGLTDPLKIKLIHQDPKLTYEKLKPELKRLRLDDKVNIVTLHQYVSKELEFLRELINSKLLTILGLASVFIFLILQNLMIFFHKHQKRFVINRLFGIGFFKTYQSVFGWWVVTSIAFVLLSYGVDQVENFLSDDTMDLRLITDITDPHFLMIIFSLLGIEILATVIALTVMERRNKIKVIKGGD
ncbi:DUF1430 domain-containing protein [Kroppenstedtia pulmonis]|uniref:DUF1430 domain-containing protein n=1 Tax=Kroppenstedtia pulmonis TaxID=1380685 RepID=A0A7D3XQE2_9BACL|nr:DUF1430 domain-containing protein [Kroppenstedtia pulmonis]QKG84707.1 DUF1430 domain-containing protein [Kroppenstedtia pulmonis]